MVAQYGLDQRAESSGIAVGRREACQQVVECADHWLQSLIIQGGETRDQLVHHGKRAAVCMGERFQCAGDGGQRAVGWVDERIDQVTDRLGHGSAEQVVDHALDGGDDT